MESSTFVLRALRTGHNFEGLQHREGWFAMGADYAPNYLSLELQPKLEATAHARGAIRGAFWDLPERVMGDLLMVVTELVTNAVRHGPGRPIGLRVSLDPKLDVIRGGVVDQGDPSESIPRIAEVTKGEGGSYGLQLVDAMTSEWYVVEGSTSVCFEIPLESG
jgi:anti-sigma regulatory factor (Ser/Thr protein kinase)